MYVQMSSVNATVISSLDAAAACVTIVANVTVPSHEVDLCVFVAGDLGVCCIAVPAVAFAVFRFCVFADLIVACGSSW